MTSLENSSPLAQYQAVKQGAGIILERAWVPFSATGPDALDYLTRRLSRSIKSLEEGSGTQCFQLAGDGKVQAEMLAYRWKGRIMLFCPSDLALNYAELTERYVLMDQVEIVKEWELTRTHALVGEKSLDLLHQLCPDAAASDNLSRRTWGVQQMTTTGGIELTVYRDGRWPSFWFNICVAAESLGHVTEALKDSGCIVVGSEALEFFRCESGIPKSVAELDEKTNPLEAGQWEGVAFERGCYPGQEALARIRNLGHPPRVFVKLRMEGEHKIEAGAIIKIGGETAGAVTSSATLAGTGKTFACGALKWRFYATRTVVIEMNDASIEASASLISQRNAEHDKFWKRIQSGGMSQ